MARFAVFFFALTVCLAPTTIVAAQAADGGCSPPSGVLTCAHPWGDKDANCQSARILPGATGLESAIVRLAGKAHFWDAARPSCPAAGAAECIAKTYLVEKDPVVLTARHGAFACATFISDRGRATTGWLPLEALRIVDPRTGEGWNWAGNWWGRQGRIAIQPPPPPASPFDATLTGETADGRKIARMTSSLDGWTADFVEPEEGICRLRAQLLDPYLAILAEDTACGGSSLVGLYRRARVVR